MISPELIGAFRDSFMKFRLSAIFFLLMSSVLFFAACESGKEELNAPDIPGDAAEVWVVDTPTPVSADTTATPVPVISSQPPLREPTESFTVHALSVEPKQGTVFEKLLSRMPDNETTRRYTRLGDFGGVLDALGMDRLEPGASREERDAYVEYVLGISYSFNLWQVMGSWPEEQRAYRKIIDTYPDLAFDWLSVEASANSSDFFWGSPFKQSGALPVSYDVAFGQFDLDATKNALAACKCDQPELQKYKGVEYFRWGEGDGRGFIKDRNKRPLYDDIGRGPDLLIRDGEAYYSIRAGVIDEHIEVIQGTRPSLADADGYLEAARWMASLGVVSEMTFRNQGFSTQGVADINERVSLAITADIEAYPLLLPFDFAVIASGFDGEREFTGLVLTHGEADTAEINVERVLTRLFNGVARRQGPGRFTPWTELIDRVDIEATGKFVVARIYFTRANGLSSLLMPNTLLVRE